MDKVDCADFKCNKFFPISVQKYPKKAILIPNLFFLFNTKLFILSNLKVLISNMAIGFFKFWTKSTQIRHFWFQNPGFFVLHWTLYLIYSKVLISNIAIVFSNSLLNLSKKAFSDSDLKFFFYFGWNFKFYKSQSGDLKLPPKNTYIRHFGPNKQFSYPFLIDNLRFGNFEGIDTKFDHRFFRFLPKIAQQGIFGPRGY